MSQDGKSQAFDKIITNDRPVANEIACECGGTIYAARSARFASCTGGEVRCTICKRPARRFGKGLTCGFGCATRG